MYDNLYVCCIVVRYDSLKISTAEFYNINTHEFTGSPFMNTNTSG